MPDLFVIIELTSEKQTNLNFHKMNG